MSRTPFTIVLITLALFPAGPEAVVHCSSEGAPPAPEVTACRYSLPPTLLRQPFRFAGEVIPLQRADVKARIISQVNFLLLDARSVLSNWLTERSRYSWIFRESFAKGGVPEEFASFAPVLSGLSRPGVRSSAAGVWYLEKPCGPDEGVEMSEDAWHDDRLDFELATRCFASRIKAIHKEVGSGWLMAAAAYVTSAKTIQELQQKWETRSYWDLPLPDPAEDLVVRWMAFSIISAHPETYGLRMKPVRPLTFDHVSGLVLAKDLHVADLARIVGVSPRELLDLNPQIKASSGVLPALVGGKPYSHSIAAPKVKGWVVVDVLKKEGYIKPSK